MKQLLPLESRVLRTIREYSLLEAGDKVLVAVSGGADSVALLFLLLALQKELAIELITAHFEHGIRGAASKEDAAFVQSLCESVSVPFFLGAGDVLALSAQWKKSLEDAARKARYDFFCATASEQKANKIALAHQQQDQAETLLLHLTHGCGLDGLSGMRLINGMLVRPLLMVSREDLEDYLRSRSIQWRDDETNSDIHYSRNLLRHKVFPILSKLNPRVFEAMGRTAFQAAKAADGQNEKAKETLHGKVKRMPYGAYWFVGDATPTIEACRLFASTAGVPPLDAKQSEALHRLLVSEICNLPSGWRAMRTKERLHLLSPAPVAMDDFSQLFQMEECDDGDLGDGIHTQVLDAEKMQGAVFRVRKSGDLFSPIGSGTQKLKKTLQDAGVDRPFRDILPLLAVGNRVLWIVGCKPSGDAAVTNKTHRKIKIMYQGKLPWEL